MDDETQVEVVTGGELVRRGLVIEVPDGATPGPAGVDPLLAAQRFQRSREAIIQSLDELAAAYAQMYVSYVRCARAQQAQLQEAGHGDLVRGVGPCPAHVEGALAFALDEVERWPEMRIPGVFSWRHQITPSHRKPMVDVDPRPALLEDGGSV